MKKFFIIAVVVCLLPGCNNKGDFTTSQGMEIFCYQDKMDNTEECFGIPYSEWEEIVEHLVSLVPKHVPVISEEHARSRVFQSGLHLHEGLVECGRFGKRVGCQNGKQIWLTVKHPRALETAIVHEFVHLIGRGAMNYYDNVRHGDKLVWYGIDGIQNAVGSAICDLSQKLLRLGY